MNKVLACCYTRFSTENQNQSSTIGQLRAIKAYCEKNNIELIDTYIDEAQSGTNMNRKNFQKMIADAPTALWDTVVVYNMSRLSRSVKDTLVIKEEFKKMGKKIISVIENQDDTPEGDFFNLITYGMNELFVKQFKRDSWRGLMVNANECKAQGGVPPLGYAVGKDKKYIINEEEAKIVRIIFDMTVKGYSYRDIANYLNSNGYTNRGKEFRVYFNDMLRNEKYAGVYVWNLRECKNKAKGKTNRKHKPESEVIRIEGGMPQIIDRETFDKVQKIMDERRKSNKYRGPRCKYLLSKILVCGKCGHAFSGGYGWSGERKNLRKYYKCTNKMCKCRDITMDYIDRYVKDLMLKTVLNSNSATIYQNFINTYQGIRKRDLDRKIQEIQKDKAILKEEFIELANRLNLVQDDTYVELTKLIGKNTADRTLLDAEELKLREELHFVSNITKSKVSSILISEKKKIKNNGIKSVMINVIHKVELNKDTIDTYIDLSYLFQIIDSVGRLYIKISVPREFVAISYLYDKIDFSLNNFEKCLKQEIKNRLNK